MAGKYARITSTLPKQSVDERTFDKGPKFRDAVNAIKDRIASEARGSGGLGARYLQLRDRQDRVARIASRVFAELTAVEELMWAALEAEGLSGVTLSDGSKVDTYDEPYSKVLDQAALLEWVFESPLRSRLSLPWQTLNTFVKERVLEGLETPPGVELKTRKTTKLRRARGGADSTEPF